MPADANLSLQSSTTVTATGNSAGVSLRLPSSTTGTNKGGTPRRGEVVRLLVTAVSGTSPTAAFVLQHSDDNSSYANRATCLTTSITSTGEYFIPFSTDKAWVRLNYTIGGTTPSFTFSAEIVSARP